MIRILFVFLLLLASVYLGIQLSRDPGYLLIAVNQWTIETTLWVAVVGCIIVFFLLHFLLLLVSKIIHLPSTYQHWRAKRRTQGAQNKTRRGLIEFSEGYWQNAKNHLIKALPDTDTPLLNYLTAARAAQEMGDFQLRDNYLREAQQSMPEAKIAVELTQAQLQLANKQWEQALATLRHLHDLAPKHPYVLKLLMQLYQEVKDWQQLITLFPELKKSNILSETAFNKLQKHTYLQAVSELAKYGQGESLTKLIANLPRSLQHDPDVMAQYAHYLIADKQLDNAEALLRKNLRRQYDAQLITLYGQINVNENQLAFAESLSKKNPDAAELYLALGRLSVAHHLWGKAHNYFDKSIEIKPSPEAYQELGQLLQGLNDQAGACRAYQSGLALLVAEH